MMLAVSFDRYALSVKECPTIPSSSAFFFLLGIYVLIFGGASSASVEMIYSRGDAGTAGCPPQRSFPCSSLLQSPPLRGALRLTSSWNWE